MGPVVMKFGGTSVADAAAISRVATLARRDGEPSAPTVIVVSAMAKVTDELLHCCALAAEGHLENVERALSALQRHHRVTVEDLSRGHDALFEPIYAAVSSEFDELRTVLSSIAVLREATPRAIDRIAASGELMSSRIVAGALAASGLDATWLDARDLVITDGGHPASPQSNLIRERAQRLLAPLLGAGTMAVTAGFIGSTPAGLTTALGRGGSDFSASLLAAAIDASEIQIWTDVDGILTADPRVVQGARLVPELSYEEASELAYFGAKVLHPSTILPAVARGIPVRVLNTMRPESPGSRISAAPARRGGGIAAVACKRGITMVDVTSSRMLDAHGFLHRVFEIFDRHQTPVDVVTTSEVSVSISIEDARRVDAIERDLRTLGAVRVDRDMAIVSAVGDALLGDPASAVRVLSALAGVPLRMVSQAASRRNVTVVLDDALVTTAVRRLYDEFFAMSEVAS